MDQKILEALENVVTFNNQNSLNITNLDLYELGLFIK